MERDYSEKKLNPKCHLTSIPNEVLLKILSYLDPLDTFRTKVVCRRFNNLIAENLCKLPTLHCKLWFMRYGAPRPGIMVQCDDLTISSNNRFTVMKAFTDKEDLASALPEPRSDLIPSFLVCFPGQFKGQIINFLEKKNVLGPPQPPIVSIIINERIKTFYEALCLHFEFLSRFSLSIRMAAHFLEKHVELTCNALKSCRPIVKSLHLEEVRYRDIHLRLVREAIDCGCRMFTIGTPTQYMKDVLDLDYVWNKDFVLNVKGIIASDHLLNLLEKIMSNPILFKEIKISHWNDDGIDEKLSNFNRFDVPFEVKNGYSLIRNIVIRENQKSICVRTTERLRDPRITFPEPLFETVFILMS